MEEIWKDIEGHDNYQISSLGRVKNKTTGRITYGHCVNGYMCAYMDGNTNISVHRLVAKAFVPNPNGYSIINHIDCDKSNNVYTNLEWCNSEYNSKYGNGFFVECVDNGNIYMTAEDAARFCNLDYNSLINALNGKYAKCGGMEWRRVKIS